MHATPAPRVNPRRASRASVNFPDAAVPKARPFYVSLTGVKSVAGIRILFRLPYLSRTFHPETILPARILRITLLSCLTALAAKPMTGTVLVDQEAPRFAAQADSLKNLGFRPISLDMRGSPDNALFSSSWVRESGAAWKIIIQRGESAFRDSLDSWAGRGYVAKAVTVLEPKFAAILEKDSTPTLAMTGLDMAGFQAAVDSAQRNRSRCVWIDAYGSAALTRFACVWKRNTEGVPWNYSFGDDAKSLHVKMDIFSRVWVRPAFLTPLPDGRIFTLWEENSIGPWAAHAELAAEDLTGDLSREASQGMFLCLQAAPTGGTSDTARLRFSVLLAERERPVRREWTVTGPEARGLEGFDDYMRELMQRAGVRAGALAIAREGRLVFSHGYTWAEPGYPETRPNSLFRAASCSKPLTSIMVHQLLREEDEGASEAEPKERPSLKEKILSLLRPTGENGEAEEPVDARFREITVDQLLTHSGGWARSRQNPDPVFNDFAPGSEIRKRLPASRKDFLKYMLGQPLQFDPGSRSVYDNFGYFLLGRMLESLPMGVGKSYESLAGERLFRPLGLSRPRFGGSRFEDRAPGEVLYHTAVPYLQANPERAGLPWVPGGYGDFDLKNMDAAGAWILSAPDYAKVLAAFDLGDGNPILKPKGVSAMWEPTGTRNGYLRGWFAQEVHMSQGGTATAKWHNGLFPGTSTLVFHLPDHFSFVLFLNRDLSPQPKGGKEGVELSRLAEAVREWPSADLFPEMGIPSFASGTPTATAGR
jgi:CubicO group peptidase (beta-lactamase class C family)